MLEALAENNFLEGKNVFAYQKNKNSCHTLLPLTEQMLDAMSSGKYGIAVMEDLRVFPTERKREESWGIPPLAKNLLFTPQINPLYLEPPLQTLPPTKFLFALPKFNPPYPH